MESHRLTHGEDEWFLHWDEESLQLVNSVGNDIIVCETMSIHRFINYLDLCRANRLSIECPERTVIFKAKKASRLAIRSIVETGLAHDDEFRARLFTRVFWDFLCGIAMFWICGGLFGLYCWYASSLLPGRPKGILIPFIGMCIHFILMLLMVGTILGPMFSYSAFRHWVRLLRVGRRARLANEE
jgi:hypothetical protein